MKNPFAKLTTSEKIKGRRCGGGYSHLAVHAHRIPAARRLVWSRCPMDFRNRFARGVEHPFTGLFRILCFRNA